MELLKKIYYIWLKVGEFLGWIWTRVLLTPIFFLVLGPIALLMRIFNKDPLKFEFRRESYWLPRKSKKIKEEDYYHQF